MQDFSGIIVIADTTPLVKLCDAGRLDILPKLYNRVIVPSWVYVELGGKPDFEWQQKAVDSEPAIEIVDVRDRDKVEEIRMTMKGSSQKPEKNKGESEAIALALEFEPGKDRLVLIDDAGGLKAADRFEVDAVGTIAVVEEAYRQSIINDDDLKEILSYWDGGRNCMGQEKRTFFSKDDLNSVRSIPQRIKAERQSETRCLEICVTEEEASFRTSLLKDMNRFEKITTPDSIEALSFAGRAYQILRNMRSDIKGIANNTGLSLEAVALAKRYIFLDEHDIPGGRRRFDPSFSIAQSWIRLAFFGKSIKPHDLLLIRRTLLEYEHVCIEGKPVDKGRRIANRKYPYDKQSREYYKSLRNTGKTLSD